MKENKGEVRLERHSIDHIPLSERHGKPRDLFFVWFSSNMQITGFVNGALAVLLGLNLFLAILAIIVGNMVGALFMAYHSVQGPRMGVPQMIQSRAQFGFVGAALPAVLVICMYMGFAVEGGVVSSRAIVEKFAVPLPVAALIVTFIPAFVAIVGYKLIHIAARTVTFVSVGLFAILTVALFRNLPGELPVASPDAGLGTVLLAIAIYVAWQLTWAPYVSDYSRYLPEDTPSSQTFIWTYAGAVLGATWVMVLGAVAATISSAQVAGDAIGMLSDQVPGVSWVILIALLVGTVPAGAFGTYGMFLTALSAVSAKGHNRAAPRVRAVFILLASTVIAFAVVLADGQIQHTVLNITLFLLTLLVPWTAINLADYYFVRRGHYDIKELFKVNGIYGLVSWPAILAYVVALFAQVPFVNTGLYTGPAVEKFGGADISWIVGIAVATLVYLPLARNKLRRSAIGRDLAAKPVDADLRVDDPR
ncbi:NCS1 family nucleobase:cation symporter-1 [Rhodococcus sp. OAS809]|uniref:purine-cytosine permease family protein n=1 Tax=Rhodococcus sp. OAS809 TaxID=2663874 RepID=UPI0017890F8E